MGVVSDEARDEFGIAKVAELPQLLGRPGVLKQLLVGSEGVELATTEPVDS